MSELEKLHDPLIERARSGDQTALPALRTLLCESEELVRRTGDVAKLSYQIMLNVTAGTNLLRREGTLRKMELLKAELAGPDPPPLEQLLVERIGVSWLTVYTLETMTQVALTKDLKLHATLQLELDRAHRRYLAAIKCLAMVRKMALPALTVKINAGMALK